MVDHNGGHLYRRVTLALDELQKGKATMRIKRIGMFLAAGCLAATVIISAAGCERKEKVVDIETPIGDVEVERDKSNGNVDVDVDDEQ